jgi:VanZ family protein
LELKRTTVTLLLIGWISFIVFVSLASFPSISQVKVENGDKYVHLILYFVLTFLLFFSRFIPSGYSKKAKLIVCLLSCILFGIIIEIMQREFTESRQFEWSDIVANSLGSLVGVLFAVKFSDKNIF